MVTVDYVKYGAVVAAVAAVYFVGYSHAETEGERALEALKLEHAQAIIAAQKKVQVDYEKRIESLIADLNNLRGEHDRRVLELQSFRASHGDLEACLSQRNDLASLGVEGERLLLEARQYLRATIQGGVR